MLTTATQFHRATISIVCLNQWRKSRTRRVRCAQWRILNSFGNVQSAYSSCIKYYLLAIIAPCRKLGEKWKTAAAIATNAKKCYYLEENDLDADDEDGKLIWKNQGKERHWILKCLRSKTGPFLVCGAWDVFVISVASFRGHE